MSFWRFEQEGIDYGQVISSEYNTSIVAISIFIACIASYAALTVASRVADIDRRVHKYAWIAAGSISLGLGVWAMHFTGMLAHHTDMPVSYSIPKTILSAVPIILGSAVTIKLLSATSVSWQSNQLSALCLAGCVGLMHFLGMEAMIMSASLKYDPFYFILSIVNAHVLASIALYIKFIDLRDKPIFNKVYQPLISSIIMGFSISGMHYTAMVSSRYYMSGNDMSSNGTLSHESLVMSIIGVVFLILFTVIIIALIEKKFQKIQYLLSVSKEKNEQNKDINRALIEHANVLSWEADVNTLQYTLMSPQAEAISGYTSEEWCQPGFWASHLFPDDKEKAIEYYQQHVLLRKDHEFEYRFIKADGTIIWFHEVVKVILDSNNNLQRLRGTLLDITERKNAEKKEKLYSRIMENSLNEIYLIDGKTFKFIQMNAAAQDNLGYSMDELKEMTPNDIQSGIATEKMEGLFYSLLTHDEEKVIFEAQHLRKNGSLYHVEVHLQILNGDDGPILYAFVVDITDRIKANEKIVYQASHDSLTGLINRQEFKHRTERVLASISNENDEHVLCFLDLDQFKIINDTCGHIAGDEMLRKISALLDSVVSDGITLARLGGDEFGILMEHCSVDSAHKIASTLQTLLNNFHFLWDDKVFKASASIGLISIDKTTTSFTDLLKDVDSACYLAKKQGRNRIHIFDPNNSEILQRQGEMEWIEKINNALNENKFCLYAQLIEPLHSSSDKHYELLIRMINDANVVIPPDKFLPAAERYNLITKIDQWVISHAINLFKENESFFKSINFCSINLSGQSLTDQTVLNQIKRELDDAKIPGHKICFEITETAAISNFTVAVKFIEDLKAYGCKFALDDFGSGLSSFGYLKKLPVDYLKIDGMFVKGIVDDTIDQAMVNSINEIGHVMGMQTIAEFVENDSIKAMLNEMGVNYVQGYGIHKPQPLEELINCGQQLKRFANSTFKHKRLT